MSCCGKCANALCVSRDKYRFYACLLRQRFDDGMGEKDMVKATRMLKAGEEEFWTNQHPQPYIFPDSPGGTSYERYECYKVPANHGLPRAHVTDACCFWLFYFLLCLCTSCRPRSGCWTTGTRLRRASTRTTSARERPGRNSESRAGTERYCYTYY